MAPRSLPDELRQFFQDYASAFESFDGNRIASFYHAPCLTMRADGSIHCLQTQEDVRRFFQNVANTYHAEGYRSGRLLDFEVVPIGARSALATMSWETLREDGSVVRRWRQSYNTARVGGQWKVLVSTIHLA